MLRPANKNYSDSWHFIQCDPYDKFIMPGLCPPKLAVPSNVPFLPSVLQWPTLRTTSVYFSTIATFQP